MEQDARTRNSIEKARFRRRNKDNGLCGCGRPRRTELTKLGRPSKLCQQCADGGRRQTASNGAAPKPRPARMWVSLAVDVRPDLVALWHEFSIEQETPLPELVETAMELLMAVTKQAEDADAARWRASA